MDIKQRIETRMKEMGFNPTQLSKLAGLNQTYVRDLLAAGDPNPRVKHLSALAETLDVSVHYLVTGERPDQPVDILDDLQAMIDAKRKAAS